MSVTDHPAGLRSGALESRFGFRVASRLSEGTDRLPHDVTERLRHARELALSRHKLAVSAATAESTHLSSSNTLSFGRGPSGRSWWTSLTAWVPLVALVAGLYLIGHFHVQAQIAAAAEVDAALLSDDLPPEAYSDPGFVEFLKTARE